MPKCYSCCYFRPTDRKCGYKGYPSYPDKECDAGEYQRGFDDCCGNCIYYDPDYHTCRQNGNSKYPYDRCDIYRHKKA